MPVICLLCATQLGDPRDLPQVSHGLWGSCEGNWVEELRRGGRPADRLRQAAAGQVRTPSPPVFPGATDPRSLPKPEIHS